MKLKIAFWVIIISNCLGCKNEEEPNFLDFKIELPTAMKEVSGLVATGEDLWAVSDNPNSSFVKMDMKGNILQKFTIANAKLIDVETIGTDGKYLFIGDIGDNEGNREQRIIYKIEIAAMGKRKKDTVNAEIILLTFPGEVKVAKKKKNEHDCEAMIHHEGSLYLFTKRRTDKDTEVFKIPAKVGKQKAESLGVIQTEGMVTDASINNQGNEIALIGYHKDHLFPFIMLLKDFNGTNFTTAKTERIELANKEWDWQLESISYNPNDIVYFACEETKEVTSTLYAIKRSDLSKLNKK